MGQSTASVPKAVSGTSHKATVDQSEPLKISVLSTEIGWCGLLGRAETVDRLLIGHHSAADVHQAVKALNLADQVNSGEEIEQENWFPELHERLQDYFQGALVEFQDININLPRLTTFQSRVIRELKKIGYGKSITYGELARKAGATPCRACCRNCHVVQSNSDTHSLSQSDCIRRKTGRLFRTSGNIAQAAFVNSGSRVLPVTKRIGS